MWRVLRVRSTNSLIFFNCLSRQPLFSSHELNPVASIAQASAPIPDGLDLDVFLVLPMQDGVTEEGGDGAGFLRTGSS
ncbi:hypothetical protein EDB19DRAFT_1704130, partial [Suillus lakei]